MLHMSVKVGEKKNDMANQMWRAGYNTLNLKKMGSSEFNWMNSSYLVVLIYNSPLMHKWP